jgi:hypothetical protein
MAAFSFDSNLLWLVPQQWDDAPIGARGTVTGTVCLDPLVDVVGFNVYGEAATDDGSGGSGGGSGGDDGVELRGDLYDESSGFVLRYLDAGSTADEHCVNLMFANLSGTDAPTWEAFITMDGPTTITRDWSFFATTVTSSGMDVVRLIPEAFAESLDQGDVVWGGFCMNPVQNLVALEVVRP